MQQEHQQPSARVHELTVAVPARDEGAAHATHSLILGGDVLEHLV